jgi:hypothetical protein
MEKCRKQKRVTVAVVVMGEGEEGVEGGEMLGEQEKKNLPSVTEST